MQIKVMGYNVLNGFHVPKREGLVDESRLASGIRLVKRENPDIVSFIEGNYGWTKLDYPELFGYPYSAHFKRGDKDEKGSILLSRFPIVRSYSDERYEHHFSKVTLDLNLQNIDITSVHPHHLLSEEDKLSFFKKITGSLPSEKQIILGDFNSFSDEDSYSLVS